MKKIIGLFTLVIIISSNLFVACSSKDSPEPGAAAGAIIATVDGTSFQSVQASAVIVNGTITVVGVDAAGKGLQVAVFKGTTSGTYDVNIKSGFPDASVSLTPTGESAYASVYYAEGISVGTVTISEVDQTNKTISGKFNSKVKRMVPAEKELEIKSGSFVKIPFTTKPAGTGSNSFSAKVDGIALTADIIGGVKAIGKITLNFSTSDVSKTLSIVVPDNVSTGSHSFGKYGATYFATYSKNSSINESASGSVNITLHDTSAKRIEGTFSFSATPFPAGGAAISVTEGSFKVSYN